MKIFICCSKAFYKRIPDIQHELEAAGHDITLPNSYDRPQREFEMKELGPSEHSRWKGERLFEQSQKVAEVDAILVLNFEKNGQSNYIGGATFLEMFKAFELGKGLFLFNPIPDGLLHDEILGMSPALINGDLSLVAEVKV